MVRHGVSFRKFYPVFVIDTAYYGIVPVYDVVKSSMVTSEPLPQPARNGTKPHRKAAKAPRPAELSPRQFKVATALAGGMSQAEASRTCKVGLRTIKTWSKTNPLFTATVRDLRSEASDRALGRLTGHMRDAVDTMHDLLKSPSDAVKLGASRAIIELTVRVKDTQAVDEIQAKLLEMEARQLAARGVRP